MCGLTEKWEGLKQKYGPQPYSQYRKLTVDDLLKYSKEMVKTIWSGVGHANRLARSIKTLSTIVAIVYLWLKLLNQLEIKGSGLFSSRIESIPEWVDLSLIGILLLYTMWLLTKIKVSNPQNESRIDYAVCRYNPAFTEVYDCLLNWDFSETEKYREMQEKQEELLRKNEQLILQNERLEQLAEALEKRHEHDEKAFLFYSLLFRHGVALANYSFNQLCDDLVAVVGEAHAAQIHQRDKRLPDFEFGDRKFETFHDLSLVGQSSTKIPESGLTEYTDGIAECFKTGRTIVFQHEEDLKRCYLSIPISRDFVLTLHFLIERFFEDVEDFRALEERMERITEKYGKMLEHVQQVVYRMSTSEGVHHE